MKRPKVKDYFEYRGKTAIGLVGNCGNYIEDLNSYIDYLESKIEIMNKGLGEIENLAALGELYARLKNKM